MTINLTHEEVDMIFRSLGRLIASALIRAAAWAEPPAALLWKGLSHSSPFLRIWARWRWRDEKRRHDITARAAPTDSGIQLARSGQRHVLPVHASQWASISALKSAFRSPESPKLTPAYAVDFTVGNFLGQPGLGFDPIQKTEQYAQAR